MESASMKDDRKVPGLGEAICGRHLKRPMVTGVTGKIIRTESVLST